MERYLPKPRSRSIVTWLFILGSLGCFVYGASLFNSDETTIQHFKAISQFIQLFFCIFVLSSKLEINTNTNPVDYNDDIYQHIKKAIPRFVDKSRIYVMSRWQDACKNTEEFKDLLILLWITWAIYFGIAFTRTLFHIEYPLSSPFWEQNVEVIEVLFNNFTFGAFGLCFLKLDKPQKNVMKDYYRPVFFFIIMLSLSHIFALWSFRTQETQVNSLFKLISGICNAVAVAGLAGRLESKNINAPSFYILVMLVYASLQPLVLISSLGDVNFNFQGASIPKTSVMALANIRLWLLAIGKASFFLFMLWLFDSKRLINYFMITPELKKEDDDFENYKHLI